MASPPQTSKKMAFVVKRCVPELVVPAKPTLHEVKKLSDIDDQRGLRAYYPGILFYRKKHKTPSSMEEGKDPVKVIREALGRALVYCYPLAARLEEGLDGEL
nr:methanol O-anthraniloyltransferase-like [Ziziphus jujuba var. spinosa]